MASPPSSPQPGRDASPAGVTRCSTGYASGNLESGVVEAVRDALASLGACAPSLAVVSVCAPGDPMVGGRILGHAGSLIAEMAPGCAILGSTAHGVVRAGDAAEMQPAVSVWLASWPGASPRPFRISARAVDDGVALYGLPDIGEDDRLAVLLVDPWSTPIDDVLAAFDRVDGALPVVGGFASAAAARGENRLLLGTSVVDGGAVGVVLDSSAPMRAVVSQGCRPFGDPMTVTSSRGAFLIEMASRPALERVRAMVSDLPEDDQALAVRGLQIGIARDPGAGGDAASDYLMRAIVGVDPTIGAITVGDEVPVGSVVRLHLRDADSADEDLRTVLRTVAGDGQPAGALLFTCNGRGRSMFTTPAHDSEVVAQGLGTDAVAGFFAAGEIGPVGGANHVHGFTAVLLVVDPVAGGEVEIARDSIPAASSVSEESAADIDAEIEAFLRE